MKTEIYKSCEMIEKKESLTSVKINVIELGKHGSEKVDDCECFKLLTERVKKLKLYSSPSFICKKVLQILHLDVKIEYLLLCSFVVKTLNIFFIFDINC